MQEEPLVDHHNAYINYVKVIKNQLCSLFFSTRELFSEYKRITSLNLSWDLPEKT